MELTPWDNATLTSIRIAENNSSKDTPQKTATVNKADASVLKVDFTLNRFLYYYMFYFAFTFDTN